MARCWLLVAMVGFSAEAKAEQSWSVVSGDTLTSIAREHSVRVSDLRRWNNLQSDQLQIGQELQVEGEPEQKPELTLSHVVQAGETLTGIAQARGMSLEALIEFNPGLDPDHIREGQVLRVLGQGREVRYPIQFGENLTMIAARYETTVSDLLRANPGLKPDYIRAGDYLTVYTSIPVSHSESLGSPNSGSLRAGVKLPTHRGYVIRDAKRAWGTVEAVYGIRRAFDEVLRLFPKAPRVEVHDLSLRRGGHLAHHRSHQSGRDADIAYFHSRCTEGICEFKRVRPSTLDTKRQWALLKPWLEAGAAESIFIDYSLQRPLYREAKRGGASREELSLWFQYPRGRNHPLGVIRHFRAHVDHLHVRFACHDTDEACRTFRPLLMQAQQAHVSAHNP